MNPDQNPNQTPYSIDYLNQISSQPKKPPLQNKLLLYIVGGGLALAIIVGAFMLLSSGSGPDKRLQTLATRLTTLRTISEREQKNIKSSSLRSTNSSLTLFLTNTNRDIVSPLANNNVDIKKIEKSITTAENGDALSKKLEDARLNAVYDRTYAREMGYQLDTVANLMKDIYDSSNSKSMKDFLLATDNNLQPIKKQFTDFNGM